MRSSQVMKASKTVMVLALCLLVANMAYAEDAKPPKEHPWTGGEAAETPRYAAYEAVGFSGSSC